MAHTPALSSALHRFPDEVWVRVMEFYPRFSVWPRLCLRFLRLSAHHRRRIWDAILARSKARSPKVRVLAALLAEEIPALAEDSERLWVRLKALLLRYSLYLDSEYRAALLRLHDTDRGAMFSGRPHPELQIAYWELEALHHLRVRVRIEAEEDNCSQSLHRRWGDRRRYREYAWFKAEEYADLDSAVYEDPTPLGASKIGGCADVPRDWVEAAPGFWRDHNLVIQVRLSHVFAHIPAMYRPLVPLPECGMLYLVENPVCHSDVAEVFHCRFFPSEDPALLVRVAPDERHKEAKAHPEYYGCGNYDCHAISGFALDIMHDRHSSVPVLPRYHTPRNPHFSPWLDGVRLSSKASHWLLGEDVLEYRPEMGERDVLLHLESKHSLMWGDLGTFDVYLPKGELKKRGFSVGESMMFLDYL